MSESKNNADPNPAENYPYALSQVDQTRSKEEQAPGLVRIKTLAREIRANAISYYGEKAFAQMCMAFEAHLTLYHSDGNEGADQHLGEGDDHFTQQMIGLLKILGQTDHTHKNGPFWQLALVWLDAQGWGEVNVETLQTRVKLFLTY